VLVPYRGATVAWPSPSRAIEVMQIRQALEVLAARLAAQQRGGAVASDLAQLVRRGNRAAASGHHGQLPQLIDRFHELVAMASGNKELIELLDQVRNKVRWMFEVDIEERAEESWADHARILDAIVAGDEDLAARHMSEHVKKDEDLWRDRVISGPVRRTDRPRS
jgi:DNA-binding GntR family transcriptional regulator